MNAAYEYDAQGQLVYEENNSGKYTYSYDTYGNIRSVVNAETGATIKTYTYSTGDWLDQMTKYGSTTINYDGNGNPTNWKNDVAWTSLTWENGRQLKSITSANTTVSYTYDLAGIRDSKTVNGVTYDYLTQNGQVVRQTWTEGTTKHVMDFIYDNNGSPYACIYDGTIYYYILNLQGDVILIVNSTGGTVGRYAYDAWGNVIYSYGDDITDINPIRYRGYYYDTETKLYYLQRRYYDPQVKRFVNADGFASTGQGFIGYNMFGYCGNSPVGRRDSIGTEWVSLLEVALHLGNSVLVCIGIDTAALGAVALDMTQDENGIYYAGFDCWQSKCGYNVFYDVAFEYGTSMSVAKFPFMFGGTSYTIWAWKGDYINLGAGAELAIYSGSGGFCSVDKSLAMWMGFVLKYNDEVIIRRTPDEYQWWITGFNSSYLNVNARELTVTFGMRFNSYGMYCAFRDTWGNDARWSFNDRLLMAFLQL